MFPVHHFTQTGNRILPSFWGPKLTHSISTETFAVFNLLQNACKMLYEFILLPLVLDGCWSPPTPTPPHPPYFFLLATRRWCQHFIFVLPSLNSQANKHMVLLLQNVDGNRGFFIYGSKPLESLMKRGKVFLWCMWALTPWFVAQLACLAVN